MSNLITRDELGLVEESFSPRSLLSLSVFGYRFRFILARSRRWKMTGKRVAIVVLHHDNAWERRVVKGLVVSMMNAYSPEEPPLFEVYSAENSLTRLHEEVLPIIAQNKNDYAAIVTTGTWVSSHVKTYINEHKWSMPQLFIGVQDPVGVGLIKNFEIPEPGIIGVNSAPLDYEHCVMVLKEIVPGLKTVLIPHDAQVGLDKFDAEKAQLMLQLEAHDVEFKLLPVDMAGDVVAQIVPHMAGMGALWVVNEAVVHIYAKKLAKMCEQYSVIYCASELASVFQGADIGWGDSGSVTGAYAGQVCFALSIGVPTTQIKNIETTHSCTARTNPSFYDKDAVSHNARVLVREVIPLGWE
ncbi:MAG: transporter substrate-binding protein [Candidatus Dependentiae bacterium]|nr:transporter substrate-binding protein [Candidatus Dependentiae bacterium]